MLRLKILASSIAVPTNIIMIIMTSIFIMTIPKIIAMIIFMAFTAKVENSGFFYCCSTLGSGLDTSCDGSDEVQQ